MISIEINHIPSPIHRGLPFPVNVCATTDIAGVINICASLADDALCRLRTNPPTPGPGEIFKTTVVQSLVQRCIDITLTVDCPDHSHEFVEMLTVTATNSTGESRSDSAPIHIRR